ncbi:MAG: DUF4838 domain-containing protein, partial [Lentisphaeria bacterium]|nr:DUF4838 domain-containing protein [Lentisphaeria bacterium]
MIAKSCCRSVFAAAVMLAAGFVFGLDLVKDGRSAFVIHVEEDAPPSVHEAASDLRMYCQRVTGVDWPIVHAAATPMISLGATRAAAAAGITVAGLEWEGFRVKPLNGDLYVLGPDTGRNERTPQGGTSAGTRNGVATLLEDYFGVRWLMPGPHGDYAPKRQTISVPDTERVEAPGFLNRRLPYIQPNAKGVEQWSNRQKLGLSLYLTHGHNWIRTCPPHLFAEHPEWYMVSGGQRTPPSGDYYKLCQTHPSTIRRFADVASDYFTRHPQATCFSLSPSDGGGWCECETCASFYEQDPLGKLSVTPAVIYFYNEVAKLVRQRFPDKLLAGYVYAQYVFPPSKPFQLEPNIFLVWAPSFDYGYTLYRPDIRELFDSLLPQWPKITSNLAFYDLPNNVSNSVGAPNAPGLEILQFLYPRIKANNMKGVYVYGHAAWGHAAVTNYLLAKLAWNPLADIDAQFKDFCDHAYAEGSEDMQAFYRLLDRATKEYYIANTSETYTLSKNRLQKVYADNFPEFARLYADALAKITDASARFRLERLGINLSILLWNLRQQKMIPDAYESALDVSYDDFIGLISNPENALYISQKSSGLPKPPAKIASAKPATISGAEPVRPYSVRGPQTLALVAETTGDIGVKLIPKRQYGGLIWGYVYDQEHNLLSRNIFRLDVPFTFAAEAGQVYSLCIDSPRDFYRIEVTNAHWGIFANTIDAGLHFIQDATPFY